MDYVLWKYKWLVFTTEKILSALWINAVSAITGSSAKCWISGYKSNQLYSFNWLTCLYFPHLKMAQPLSTCVWQSSIFLSDTLGFLSSISLTKLALPDTFYFGVLSKTTLKIKNIHKKNRKVKQKIQQKLTPLSLLSSKSLIIS